MTTMQRCQAEGASLIIRDILNFVVHLRLSPYSFIFSQPFTTIKTSLLMADKVYEEAHDSWVFKTLQRKFGPYPPTPPPH